MNTDLNDYFLKNQRKKLVSSQKPNSFRMREGKESKNNQPEIAVEAMQMDYLWGHGTYSFLDEFNVIWVFKLFNYSSYIQYIPSDTHVMFLYHAFV